MLLINQRPFRVTIAEISGFDQQVNDIDIVILPILAAVFFFVTWLFSPSFLFTAPAISPLFDGRVTLAEGKLSTKTRDLKTRKEY